MLEKYLQDKGLTPNDIYKAFPTIEDNMRNYFAIKEMGGGSEYKDELNKLSNEIIEFIKKNEDKLIKPEPEIVGGIEDIKIDISEIEMDMPKSEAEELPEIQIPDIQIPDIEIQIDENEIKDIEEEVVKISQPKEPEGYLIQDATLTSKIWMKILALAEISDKWKESSTYNFQFWIGNKGYLVTSKNPFENKNIDIFIFGENKEQLINIVKSKIISFGEKGNTRLIETNDIYDVVNSDSIEPMTQMPYKLVDETIEDIWKLKSMAELSELLNLSKKYGCGCGSI